MRAADIINSILHEAGARSLARRAGIRDREGRRIRVTYSTYDPDTDEEDNGWEDEEGWDMELDDIDRDEGLTVVDKARNDLGDAGVMEPSATPWSVGTWYSGQGDTDIRTGVVTTLSYHLSGFTPEEEEDIYAGL